MKKSLLLAAFLLTAFANAQKPTVFESKIQPEKNYTLETTTVNNMNMDVPGQDKISILQEIKGPFTMKTSKLTNGLIPAELSYGDVSVKQMFNGKPQDEKAKVSGMTFIGKFDAAGKFTVESAKAGEVTDELKTTVTNLLEKNLKTINFPQKALAIGDSFEDATPMTIPMGQLGTIDAEIKTNYTLTKIENGVGYFDTKQVMTMKGSPSGMEMSAKGTGNGKLEMSIADKYMKKFATALDMDVEIKATPEMTVVMKTQSTTSTSVVITKA